MDADLTPRSLRDYGTEPVNTAGSADARLARAVGRAYPELLQQAAAALQRGQSVLLEAPPGAATAWIDALREPSGRKDLEDFVFFRLEDTRVGYMFAADNPVVEDPVRQVLQEGLQRFLWNGAARSVGVLEMLDAVITGGGTALAELFILLTAHRFADRPLVGVVTPGLPVPLPLRRRFPIHLRLPPLARERLWTLLSYAEVQAVLGANQLTVPMQVRLHQLLGRLDVWTLRALVEQLANAGQPIQSPAQALAHVLAALAPEYRVPGAEATPPPLVLAALTQAIVTPWSQLRAATDPAHITTLERSWPTGTLLTSPAAPARATAAWLAAACEAALSVTAGWDLAEAVETLRSPGVLPRVVFVQDLETADAAAQRAWLRLRATFRPEDPLWLVAHTADPAACLAGLRSHCTLHLALEG